MLALAMSAIDKLISNQLYEVVNATAFKKLYARWLGLHYLCNLSQHSDLIKIKLLNCGWDSLMQDFNKYADIEASTFFKAVYSDEYDHPGGEPFGLLIGDYQFSIHNGNANELYFLGQLSEIMQRTFVPFLASISPESLELQNFVDFNPVEYQRQKPHYFSSKEWTNLRERESSRYLGLIIPNVLVESYNNQFFNTKSFYAQLPRIWLNGAFAYAAVIIQGYQNNAWFLDATGINDNDDSNGRIPIFSSEGYQGITEFLFDDVLEKQFAELGLTTIVQLPYMSSAYILHGNSATKYRYRNDLSHTLPYLLCACRFAHYLKVIQRNFIGSSYSVADCQYKLQNWLNQYVASNHDLPSGYRYKYPLQEGKIQLAARKGSEGSYICKATLQPYIKTSHASLAITITTEFNIT